MLPYAVDMPSDASQQDAVAKYMKRHGTLKTERSTWIDHWRDLANHVIPRRFRYLQTDVNKGWKKNQFIINGVATWAVRVGAAGMVAGITSPSRPWFNLTTEDPSLAEFGPVKAWLYTVAEILRIIIAKSNIYNALHNVYTDDHVFGTTVMHVDEDVHDIVRAYVFPVGQYCLANSPRLNVDTIYRDFRMTSVQLVQAFGLARVSPAVANNYKRGNYDSWHDVVHVVEPNYSMLPDRIGAVGMPWKSVWYESGGNQGKTLREAGYQELPTLAVRWNTTAEDAYGSSPAMDALGDIRALQQYEKKKALLVEKIANPPMKGPMSLLGQKVSIVPGDFTPVAEQSGTLQPSMVVPPASVQVTTEAIREHEARINKALMADLWLMMANSTGQDPQRTAREVAELHEEKLLQLGPVLERLEDELLDPLINRVFWAAWRRKLIPPPPRELQGKAFKPEYISIMAQAQKAIGANSLRDTSAFVGNLAGVKPEVLDVLNSDELVRQYADANGTPPTVLNSPEQVAAIRQQRAQQQQAVQQAQQAQAMAQGAQTLSQADMSGDNALTRLVSGFGGGGGGQ